MYSFSACSHTWYQHVVGKTIVLTSTGTDVVYMILMHARAAEAVWLVWHLPYHFFCSYALPYQFNLCNTCTSILIQCMHSATLRLTFQCYKSNEVQYVPCFNFLLWDCVFLCNAKYVLHVCMYEPPTTLCPVRWNFIWSKNVCHITFLDLLPPLACIWWSTFI